MTYAIAGPLLGIISAAYNLGAIFAVPVVPWVANRWGRRWSIFIGSAFQCIGAVIQCFSVNGIQLLRLFTPEFKANISQWVCILWPE